MNKGQYHERSSRVFRDASKLSFDYVPDRLVHREAQLAKLWMLFRPVLEQGVSQSAFLIGPVGTGKTATSKRFCLDLVEEAQSKEKAMDFVIVNCRQRNSESSVLLRLVTHFDEHFPDRGFSSAEMLRSLRKHIEKQIGPMFLDAFPFAGARCERMTTGVLQRLGLFT